jgi:hypothetical protein
MSSPDLMYASSAWQMTTSSGLVLLCSFWCHSSIMPPCAHGAAGPDVSQGAGRRAGRAQRGAAPPSAHGPRAWPWPGTGLGLACAAPSCPHTPHTTSSARRQLPGTGNAATRSHLGPSGQRSPHLPQSPLQPRPPWRRSCSAPPGSRRARAGPRRSGHRAPPRPAPPPPRTPARACSGQGGVSREAVAHQPVPRVGPAATG